MFDGILRRAYRRVAGRSYRRRRAEAWASVYRATFETEGGEDGARRRTAADGGCPDSARD